MDRPLATSAMPATWEKRIFWVATLLADLVLVVVNAQCGWET